MVPRVPLRPSGEKVARRAGWGGHAAWRYLPSDWRQRSGAALLCRTALTVTAAHPCCRCGL